MKIKRKKCAQIDETIGAVARVVSTIYVASLITIASDAAMADVLRRGTEDPDALTDH